MQQIRLNKNYEFTEYITRRQLDEAKSVSLARPSILCYTKPNFKLNLKLN